MNNKISKKMISDAYEGHRNYSFYQDNQKYNLQHQEVNDNLPECDVCIVGGGITGVNTALNLANLGYKVVLLEKDNIAKHASGVNGGFVSTSYMSGINCFREQFGDEGVKQFWNLSVDGMQIIKNNIQKYNIDCAWQNGVGRVAYLPTHVASLESDFHARSKYYSHLQFLNKQETRDLSGSDAFHAALINTKGGHFNPLNYISGLAKACEEAQVKIYNNARVTKIKFNQNQQHILMINDKFEIKAKFVVLACNFNNNTIIPGVASNAIKFNTYILSTVPLDKTQLESILKKKCALSDTRNIMNYFRLSENNTLLFGGGDTFGKANINKVQANLYKEMIQVFPQLSGIKIQNFWSGIDSMSLNLAPTINKLYDTVYYAHGYAGHGMNVGTIIGTIIAEAIHGQSQNFDLFAAIRPHKLSGNSLIQKSLLQLGILHFKIKDRIDIAKAKSK